MKKVSTEYIIGKTIKDFKIEDSSWVGDAVDWVGDAIEGIGYHCGFIKETATILTKNHLAAIPCNLVSLYGVLYKGARLSLGSDVSGLALFQNENESTFTTAMSNDDFQRLRVLWAKLDVIDEIEEPTAEDLEEKEDILREIQLINSSKKLNNSVIEQSVIPYYNINANFIQTSFSSDYITLLYYAFQLDSKGFPMIYDTYKYREAVKWFILRNTLLQGYKHPVVDFKYADAKWEEFRHKASNEQKMPSLDKLERFHKRWHSVKRGIQLADDWYMNAEANQGTII